MAACHCDEHVEVGMPDEVLSANQLKTLVRHVVAAQGNGFIKDLLRERGYRLVEVPGSNVRNL